MTTTPSADRIVRGLQELDGTTVAGLVLDDTYAFDPDHDATDIVAYEQTDGDYTRLAATARVERIGTSWKLFLDDITTSDLSGITARSGVYWLTDAALDADRRTIGFGADPGGPIDPYEPTWDDGFLALPIEAITDRLVPDPTTGDVGQVAVINATKSGWELGDLADAISTLLAGDITIDGGTP